MTNSAIAAAAAFCLLLGGCSRETEKEAEPIVPVQVAPVVRQPIQRIVAADGVLRALDQSAIVPKISAPVARFYVNRGDPVRKGQLLATLENRDLTAGVVDAKGAYEQAVANFRNVSSATVPDELVKAQAEVQVGKQTADAARNLLDSRQQLHREGALARRMVDEAAVAYAQARGQYETAVKHLASLQEVGRHEEVKGAAALVDSAKGKYDAAQAQLGYSEVRSPISGVVAERPLFQGEMAAAGVPMLTVMDVSSVIARVSVPQGDAAFVRVGQPATIAASDRTTLVNGKVTVVSPAVDPQSTTIEIWVQAANPGGRLRPGGTVHVRILAGAVADAVVAPAVALLPAQDGGTALMVVGSDSIAHERRVEAGIRTPEAVQILTGAEPGQQVVVSGGVGLQDGTKVRIRKADAATSKEEAEGAGKGRDAGQKHE